MAKPLEISLYRQPVDRPLARVPAGELAEELLEISNKTAKPYNSRAREVLGEDNLYVRDGQLVGSSHMIRAHLAPILRDNFNLEIVGLEDMGTMLANNPDALRGFYIDGPIVRHNEKDPHSYLTKKLDPQLKKLDWKGEAPIIIENLETENDKELNYGLSFKVGEHTTWQHAPWLVSEGRKRFSGFGEDGIEFDDTGNYTFYPGSNGLTGLSLYRYLVLVSFIGDLAFSYSNGRVWTTKRK